MTKQNLLLFLLFFIGTTQRAIAQEAYAVLSDDGNTVTFYYDNQKASRPRVVGINQYNIYSMSNAYGTATTAVIDASFADYRPTSTYCWFSGCKKLKAISGIENLNTSNVTDMGEMFYGCRSLTSLDISNFNTSNVTDMGEMFCGCSSLTSLDLRNFNTSNVTDMCSMFSGCSSLTSLDISSFNTSNVTNMRYMFSECGSLTSLDLSNFSTSNVTDIRQMFLRCSSLTSLNVCNFNTFKVMSMEDMFSGCSSLTSLDVSNFNTSNVTSMAHMFSSCSSLSTLNLSDFNTSKVTNMTSIFSECSSLTSLDVSNFNTSNVISMDEMFSGCRSLTSLDVSNFNTSNVISMNYMFYGCSSLISLNLSYFNTSNVTDMNCTFGNCSSLTSLDVSNFNTSNVTSMAHMFYGCSSLISLNISYFNTSNVTDMNCMFGDCSSLTSLDVSNFNTFNVNNMYRMFGGCRSLKTIYVSWGWNTAAQSFSMFHDCEKLIGGAGTAYDANHVDEECARIDGGTESPGYFTFKIPSHVADPEPYVVLSHNGQIVTFYYDGKKAYRTGVLEINQSEKMISIGESNAYGTATIAVFDSSFADYYPTSTAYWFMECRKLTSISGIEFLNTTMASDMGYMFAYCTSLTSLDVSNFNTSNVTRMACMFSSCSSLCTLNLSNFNTFNVTSMYYMFSGCSSLTSLDLSNFNTSNVTDLKYMFSNCRSLTSLDISNFNTSNVTNMRYMFDGCSSLTTLDVSNFITSNVTSMGHMFEDCKALTSLNVSNFNTSNVTDMYYMFDGCSSLTSLDVSNFNTSNVKDMGCMFAGCNSLISLDVNNFNTSNVKDMGCMFAGCSSLTSLDVSNFNTSKVTDMNSIFYGCSSLNTIYVGKEWTTNAITVGASMFENCTALVGGAGTAYDANHTDAEYARIDGGTDAPGYFTNKNAPTPTILEKPVFNSNSAIENLNTAHLYWDAVEGASGYEIKAANMMDVSAGREAWEKATILYSTTVGADINDLKIEHLNYDTRYRFAIRALSPYGEEYCSEWFGYGAPLEFNEFFGLETEARFISPEVVSRGSIQSTTVSIQLNRNISGYSDEKKSVFREHFNFIDDAKNMLKIDYLTVTPSPANPDATVGSAYTKYQIPESAWDSNGTARITIEGLTSNAAYNITAWDESIPWEQDAYYNIIMARTKQNEPVTLTAKSYTREYGEENPVFEYEVTEGAITSGTPEINCEATASSPVGTYDIIISKGTVSNNGTVELVKGTLTITKAPLIISVESSTKEEGEDNPEFTLTYNGFKNGETEDVLSKQPPITTTATKESSAGEYDIKVSGAEAQNYSISYRRGTLTITAKPIEIVPVEEETKMNTEELNGQDLSNNVVNDVYYNVGDGGYDATDQSIVISQPTNMSQIADKQPGSADVKENFNGMILKVAKGKGLITVNVKTSGNAQLVVQVGNGTPMLASKTEKGDVVFSYDVEEDTYVYIYAIIGSSAAKGYGINATDTDSSVRIYSITVSPGATGIRSIGSSEKNDNIIYDLQGRRVKNTAKGVCIVGGRKYSVK